MDNLDHLSLPRNTSSALSFRDRQEIRKHYHAGKTDQQIAEETKIPRHLIEEFRVARFLKPN